MYFLGFETARSLAFHGCTVIFACRDASKAEEAVARIRAERSHVTCEFIALDLQSLHSTRIFALTFQQRYRQVSVV